MSGGFIDPDYARDRNVSLLMKRVSALEQRVADLERANPAENSASSPSEASASTLPPDELSLLQSRLSSSQDTIERLREGLRQIQDYSRGFGVEQLAGMREIARALLSETQP